MFHPESYNGTDDENERLVLEQLRHLIEGETNAIANYANASALLHVYLKDINWVGFYLYTDGQLVLGPFQGLPACVRIPLGKGVCGTAAASRETVLVEDVYQFPGHIACDAASNSEIVVPLLKNGELLAVLDIDSPLKARFGARERLFLERFAEILTAAL